MRQRMVCDLDEETVEALQRTAAANGRSVEAEHRAILRAHLAPRPAGRSFKEVLANMPYFDDDELFEIR